MVIHAGERYDFILNATVTPVRNHWMRVHGLDDCSNKSVHQEAILRYSGALEKDPIEPTDYEFGAREGMVHTYKSQNNYQSHFIASVDSVRN